MIETKENESRIDYLVRVLEWFSNNTIAGEQLAHYDEAECDFACLVDDIKIELGIE